MGLLGDDCCFISLKPRAPTPGTSSLATQCAWSEHPGQDGVLRDRAGSTQHPILLNPEGPS